MHPFIKIVFSGILALFLMESCRKPKCEEIIPAIAFKDFKQYRDIQGNLEDTAKLIITFKDCDGDIGVQENIADTASPYYYNYIFTYYEMVNGAWVNSCDTCFRYRIPELAAEGQSKILEGEIGITISPFYFNFMSAHSDTIKYSVVLYDKELHESNVAETPMILTK